MYLLPPGRVASCADRVAVGGVVFRVAGIGDFGGELRYCFDEGPRANAEESCYLLQFGGTFRNFP